MLCFTPLEIMRFQGTYLCQMSFHWPSSQLVFTSLFLNNMLMPLFLDESISDFSMGCSGNWLLRLYPLPPLALPSTSVCFLHSFWLNQWAVCCYDSKLCLLLSEVGDNFLHISLYLDAYFPLFGFLCIHLFFPLNVFLDQLNMNQYYFPNSQIGILSFLLLLDHPPQASGTGLLSALPPLDL